MMRKLIGIAVCLCLTMAAQAADTQIPDSKGVPDLTKGGLLTRINKDWIGPLGIYCGAWRPVQGRDNTHQANYVRQLLVLEVDAGSPADRILNFGDVILGADGTGAANVPLIDGRRGVLQFIADAITEAEARNPSQLKLLIWRPIKPPKSAGTKKDSVNQTALDDVESLTQRGSKGTGDLDDDAKDKTGAGISSGLGPGKMETVTIKLEHLGRYSDTAPYNCEKSKTILRTGIKKIYDDNKPDKVGFDMLCLLAADDPTNPDNAKYQARARELAHKIELGGGPWFSGPKLIALSEYFMKTKDKSIFPKLVEQAEYHARGVSWFGTTGHKWADKRPDGSYNGPMTGYGPIGASGTLGYLGLSLARKAGVKSAAVDAAIESQRKFFGHYAFRGAPSYGEFYYSISGGTDDNNGKCAMTALALGLDEGREEKAKYFVRKATLTDYGTRIYAHGGVFFGQMWEPLGAALGGIKTANLTFRTIRPHLEYCRGWDHARIYDGSGNPYADFGRGATALLFYALPLQNLYITGRGQKESLKLTDSEFKDLVAAKDFNASKATTQELIAALSRWQGMLRGAVADELAARVKAKPENPESVAIIDQLLKLASDNKVNPAGRTGACDALRKIKNKAAGLLASLRTEEITKTGVAMLKDPDAYIRFGGARLLEELKPESVMPYANQIIDAIIATGRPVFPLDEEDPLQTAHSAMGSLLFNNLLGKSLDGVDHKKLVLATRSMLATPNSQGRNSAARVLEKLSMDEVLQLADVLVDNARNRAPANAMFGVSYMQSSRKILAEHQFEEALPVSLLYGGAGIDAKIPEKYGKSVMAMESGPDLMDELCHLMMSQGLDTRQTLNTFLTKPGPETVNQLKRIRSVNAAEGTLTLPTAQTKLVVDATNYGVRDENGTTYTWRKVYGAGRVAFTPNGSPQAKTTIVSFTDKKPGTYRFEVSMSDTLGICTARKTLDVTLYDNRGKLPANNPPQALSQTLTAVPGLPRPIALSGTDPDGDDLGFVVTKQPSHGRLSGNGGRLTYLADYGHPLTKEGDSQLSEDWALDRSKKSQKKPKNAPTKAGTSGKQQPEKPALTEKVKSPATTPKRKPAGDLSSWTDSFSFDVIDGQGKTATGTITLNVSDKNVGVAVYEPFDGYQLGNIIGQPAKGIGLSGAWTTARKVGFNVSPGSLCSSALPSSGNKLMGNRMQSVSIGINPDALTKHGLLANGGELWFSAVLGNKIDIQEFSLNGKSADVGFAVSTHKATATVNFNQVVGQVFGSRVDNMMAKGVVNQSQRLSGAGKDWVDNGPNLFIGHCIWGKADEDEDTVELYRVVELPTYGPLVIKEPISVVKGKVAQGSINTITIGSGSIWDEIRIGSTLNSVLLGTKPL